MKNTHSKRRTDLWLGETAIWMEENQETNREQLLRMREKLHQACQIELTPRQQQIVALYFENGLSISAIARQLGLHRTTVSRTLQRAKRVLSEHLRYAW